MIRSWHRIAIATFLGVLAVALPSARAQRVDFERETHFRC
jgi:hypothetical protein